MPPVSRNQSGVVPASSTWAPTSSYKRGPRFSLGRLESPSPVPMVLQLSSEPASDSPFGPPKMGAYDGYGVGSEASVEAYISGAVRLVYGALGCSKEVWFDARSGSYQLPPCQSAEATFVPYSQGYGLSGALTPGLHPGAIDPWCTSVFEFAGPDTAPYTFPFGTRAVDLHAVGVAVGSALKVFLTGDSAFPCPAIERDYSSGLFSPPWGPVDVFSSGTANLEVTGACTVVVRAYLSL